MKWGRQPVTDNGVAPAKPVVQCGPPEPYRMSDIPELVMVCMGNLAGLFFEFMWPIIILIGVAIMAGYRP